MNLNLNKNELELLRLLLEEKFWIEKSKGNESEMEIIMDLDSKLCEAIEEELKWKYTILPTNLL